MKIFILLLLYLFLAIVGNAQPTKVDFSQEWAKELDNYAKGKPSLDQLKSQDLSAFFLSQNDRSENGVFDKDYWRIQFHIHSVVKDPSNPLRYLVKGKSKLRSAITSFRGTLTITQARVYETALEMNESLYSMGLIASYNFVEEGSGKTSGVFSGTLHCILTYPPSTQIHWHFTMKTPMAL